MAKIGLTDEERHEIEEFIRQRVAKTLLERSLQMLKLLRRWLPRRELVVVSDNAYAALEFLDGARQVNMTVIARLRLGAWVRRYTNQPRHTADGDDPVRKTNACPPWQRFLTIRPPTGNH